MTSLYGLHSCTAGLESPADKLVALIRRQRPRVHTIAWDLDGTLGPLPGWMGWLVASYIVRPGQLAEAMATLRHTDGVKHVLVSRNGLCCGAMLPFTRAIFTAAGFDEVLACYRARPHSKVRQFPAATRAGVLLIDDQAAECAEAVADGAQALQVHAPIMDAVMDPSALVRKA
jgi:hypothetical protein